MSRPRYGPRGTQLCAICERPRRGHGARPHRFAQLLPPSAALDRLLSALVDEAAPSHATYIAAGGDAVCSASCRRCRLVGALERFQISRRRKR